MKRLLVASTVVLSTVLAFLVYQRLVAPPPAPPPAPAAAPEPPRAPEPARAAAAPPEATASGPTGPASTTGPAGQAVQAAREAPAELAHHEEARAAPEPRERPRRPAPALPDAAAAAIFADRPGDGERAPTPRLPVLRKPAAGVAPAPHTVALAATAGRGDRHGAPRPPARHAAPSPHPAPPSPPAAPPAPPLLGAVSGTLHAGPGGPVAGVPVLALAAAGDDAFETITDDDGFYLLAGLRPGRYLLFAGLGSRAAPPLSARAVEVEDGRVSQVELHQPGRGATVRVHALRADGRPLAGQPLLVAGALPSPATFQALLGSDAIFLPEGPGPGVLRRVPAGVYTLVVLQGPDAPPRVARQPVAVRGDGEQVLEVRFPDEGATAPAGPRG